MRDYGTVIVNEVPFISNDLMHIESSNKLIKKELSRITKIDAEISDLTFKLKKLHVERKTASDKIGHLHNDLAH